jgi:translocation protein SEC63
VKYHPDHNPGDPVAAAKFLLVKKAYQTLTDETAKKNFEEFGNPDGRQSLEFGLGLPSFLLDPSFRYVVLITYLVMMVAVIPLWVWTYYTGSSKYGEKDVMYDTYSWYHHSLSEHMLDKALPEVLAGSAEFCKRNIPASYEEMQAIGQLTTQVGSQMLKPRYNHPVCVKGNVLLTIHLLRKTDLLNLKFANDLKYMIQHSARLIDAMISVCKHQDALQTAINCVEFEQCMTQAVPSRCILQKAEFYYQEGYGFAANPNVAFTP